jgi:hypothetical protein
MFDKKFIKETISSGRTFIVFTKTNGEKREMVCTLRSDLIPSLTEDSDTMEITEQKRKKKQNPDVLSVWDLHKGEWRSFRYDSVTYITLEDSP